MDGASHLEHHLAALDNRRLSPCASKTGENPDPAYIDGLLCPVRVFNGGIIALNPLIVDELGCQRTVVSLAERDKEFPCLALGGRKTHQSGSSFRRHLHSYEPSARNHQNAKELNAPVLCAFFLKKN